MHLSLLVKLHLDLIVIVENKTISIPKELNYFNIKLNLFMSLKSLTILLDINNNYYVYCCIGLFFKPFYK